MNKSRGKQERPRSGKIPAFGNWDQVKELPITQYFENARQAGLKTSTRIDYVASQSKIYNPKKRSNTINTTYSHFEEHEKKVGGNISYTQDYQLQNQNITTAVVAASHRKPLPTIKPVDEDLYKIPSDILHNSKRVQKKFFGFFSRCFVPHTI